MPEEKRISPAVVIIPVALGLAAAAVIVIAGMAKAAPPKEYLCPYCGATFSTYEELATHVQSIHPGQRIPLPIVWE